MRALAAMLLAVAVAVLVTATGIGQRVELASIDARYEQRGAHGSAGIEDVAVLEVDEVTDERVRLRWPYPRDLHADALDALADAGVRAIVLDVQFLDPSDRDGAADDELVAAIARVERQGVPVVLATAQDAARGGVPLPFSGVDAAAGDEPGTRLARSRAHVGRTDTDVDRDGIVRHAPPLHVGSRIPSLALAALRATGDDDGLDVGAGADGHLLSLRVPRDRILARNYADAILGADDPGALLPLADRVVFVGATSEVLHDQVRTPLDGREEGDEALPGVYVHVQSWLDLRAGGAVRVAPAWVGPVVALLLALVLGLLATGPLRRHVVWWTLLGLALPLVWIALAVWAFAQRDLVLPIAAPVLGALAALVLLVVAVARHALHDRRRVAAVFSRYLAPKVVRQLLADDALDVAPGGTSAEVTVLFSDVRGFTELSTRTEAGELVAQLNEYFEEMVAAVDAQEGTVDKFLGDGMMAFFGAPAHQPDHAERACAAAQDMLARLEQVNVRRAERDLPALAIGIGVATGRVVVGNIGSTRRLEYTAIGDAVNLAARLEGVSKRLGVPIVLAQATAAQLDEGATRGLGRIEVRGVAGEVEVATLVGPGPA